MPGRDHRSARVVIMDDISWSEPTPRRRRASSELNPPEWMQQPEPRFAPADQDDRFEEQAPVEDGLRSRSPRPRRREEIVRYEESSAGAQADEPFDEALGELIGRWQSELAGEPPPIEYAAKLDDEQIWGPRPKLMAEEPGGRRTIVITGRGADRHIAPRSGTRARVPGHARHGFAADRTAMWAVLLCVILLLVALTSH